MRKKGFRIVVLVAAVMLMTAVLLTGCGNKGTSTKGQELTEENFALAMSDSGDAMEEGSFTIKMTMKMKVQGQSFTMKLTMKVQDGNKMYFEMSYLGQKEAYYMENTGSDTYEIRKNEAGKWVGILSDEDFFSDAFSQAGANPLETADDAEYSQLEFRNGRYYYSADLLAELTAEANKIINMGVNYEEIFMYFKDNKLAGVIMKYSAVLSGTSVAYDVTMTIDYSATVNIPSYTVG